MCAVVNATGYMSLWMGGNMVAGMAGSTVPVGYRVNNWIGRSNWSPPNGGDNCAGKGGMVWENH